MHGRWYKLSATRDLHVSVGVRYDSVPVRINNLPIHARVMTTLFFQDRERARLCQVAVTGHSRSATREPDAHFAGDKPSVLVNRSRRKFPRAVTPLRRTTASAPGLSSSCL